MQNYYKYRIIFAIFYWYSIFFIIFGQNSKWSYCDTRNDWFRYMRNGFIWVFIGYLKI